MDAATILAITSISGLGLALLTKVLLVLRKNVRSCCFITFRSPDNSVKDKNEKNENEIEITNQQSNKETIHITPDILNAIKASGRNLI